jgi:hypothetical protein
MSQHNVARHTGISIFQINYLATEVGEKRTRAKDERHDIGVSILNSMAANSVALDCSNRPFDMNANGRDSLGLSKFVARKLRTISQERRNIQPTCWSLR